MSSISLPIVLDLSPPIGTATAAVAANASSPRYRLSRDDPDNGGELSNGGGGVMPSRSGGGDVVTVGELLASDWNGEAMRGGGDVGNGGG